MQASQQKAEAVNKHNQPPSEDVLKAAQILSSMSSHPSQRKVEANNQRDSEAKKADDHAAHEAALADHTKNVYMEAVQKGKTRLDEKAYEEHVRAANPHNPHHEQYGAGATLAADPVQVKDAVKKPDALYSQEAARADPLAAHKDALYKQEADLAAAAHIAYKKTQDENREKKRLEKQARDEQKRLEKEAKDEKKRQKKPKDSDQTEPGTSKS
jgi:hypothetical protein